jgi:hypothetical protein
VHSYARTVVVPRPAGRVFALLCDLASAPAYRPDLARIQVVTPHPRAFGHGTRWLETHTPRAGPFRLRATTRCEVVECSPPEVLAIARSEGRRRSTVTFRLWSEGPGCRVEMKTLVEGPTPRAARRWGRRLERFDEALLFGFKEHAMRRIHGPRTGTAQPEAKPKRAPRKASHAAARPARAAPRAPRARRSGAKRAQTRRRSPRGRGR